MFDYTGSIPFVTKAQLEKIIIEGDSITIGFKEGYEDAEGNFIPFGSDHVTFTDEGFLDAYNSAEDKEEFIKEIVDGIKHPPIPEEPEEVEELED